MVFLIFTLVFQTNFIFFDQFSDLAIWFETRILPPINNPINIKQGQIIFKYSKN